MSENTSTSVDGPERSPRRPASIGRHALEWLANRNAFAVMAAFFAMGFLAGRSGLPEPVDVLLYLTGGLLPLVLATVSTSEDGYDHDVSNATRIRFLISQLVWAFTPWGILTQVLQVAGTVTAYVRYLGRLPDRERHVPETQPTAPFGGRWTTVNGGITKATSHSWGIVSQRYAYDFVVTDEDGNTHDGDGSELTDYHAFGEPIRAPADGEVVKTRDGLRDHPRPGTGWLEWRTWDIPGNHVVIEHDDGAYSTLAHLREDSLRVEPGDRVERGEVVAECGNSGTSTEPHLHYQIQDRRNFWFAAGLVPEFRDVTVTRPDDRRATHEVYDPAGDAPEGTYLWAGDRVEPATQASDEGA